MRLARTLLSEPLVQFLVLGGIVAALLSLSPQPSEAPEASSVETIVVTPARLAQIDEMFRRTWQRPPTEEEARHLRDGYLREEVLYRAGRALGLGEDDPVVRQRIAQKMQFILEPTPAELEPEDADLVAHLAAHRERFRTPVAVTLRQVLVKSGTERAEAVLSALTAGADPQSMSDPTLLPATLASTSMPEIVRIFGQRFAGSVMEVPAGEWAGPLDSPYGLHLVLVENRIPARDPDLADIRSEVAQDWRRVRRDAIADRRFQELKARYPVTFEEVETAGETAPR